MSYRKDQENIVACLGHFMNIKGCIEKLEELGRKLEEDKNPFDIDKAVTLSADLWACIVANLRCANGHIKEVEDNPRAVKSAFVTINALVRDAELAQSKLDGIFQEYVASLAALSRMSKQPESVLN